MTADQLAREFVRDRKIDPGQLDLEAVRQADQFFKWAERAVKARMDAERAKVAMEVKEASLNAQCRKRPEDFGLVRTTETAITMVVTRHKSYRAAVKRYLDLREESLLLDKMVDAMEQRKRMIEVLVTLHGQNYFAGPGVPRDIMEAWKKSEKRRESSVNRKQKNRVRSRKRKTE